jgi:hypothetical protein
MAARGNKNGINIPVTRAGETRTRKFGPAHAGRRLPEIPSSVAAGISSGL